MAASICVETVLSKLLRLLFKDVLLRNQNRKQQKNSLLFMGISYSFKINKTTAVYILPFKTYHVKMKIIFSLKVTIKVTFL